MIFDDIDGLSKYNTPKHRLRGKKENKQKAIIHSPELRMLDCSSLTFDVEDNETEVSSKLQNNSELYNQKNYMQRENVLFDNQIDLATEAHSIISDIRSFEPKSESQLRYTRKAESLRLSYIAKLIYQGVWQPSMEIKNHNNLIIFDWDDTLLCTTFLTPSGIFNENIILSESDMEKILKLELVVFKILSMAINKGDTYIVTNAAPGWVEYSCERFYPSVKNLLSKVTIISARGEYESLFPGDSRMWKIQAFLKMQKSLDVNLVTNLICVGDSFIEMEAAHILASKFSQAFIKTIKFRECPKIEELYKQLLLVSDQFSAIYSGVKNLTIKVEKKR